MKKKLTVNSLAFENLKSRKKQYTIMIIGIILAMVFSSSILLFLSCMKETTNQISIDHFGNQDCIFIDTNDDLMNKMIEENLISEYGYAHTIGFCYSNENETDKGSYIAWLDDNAKESSRQSLIEGTYPTNENEIALERNALNKLGVDAKIGDTIKLSVLTQNGNEFLSDTPEEKEYKLVGILKDKRNNLSKISTSSSNNLPAAFVCDNTKTELGGKERLDAYIISTDINKFARNIFEFLEENNVDTSIIVPTYMLKNDFSNWSRLIASDTTDIDSVTILSTILTSVLLIASCLGIINSFNNNLKGRKKQIGMLRTVGATKRQIISIFGREAFIISILSVPISILISYFLVKTIIKLLGNEFVFAANWKILISCAIVGVICVMLSALIPLINASRISPIQAIRNIDITRKMKTKHIHSQNNFNTSKLLAKRNLSFYKSKQVIVSTLLVITIVLSCFGFSFNDTLLNEMDYSYPYDYEVYSFGNKMNYFSNLINFNLGQNSFTEKDKQDIINSPYNKTVNGRKECSAMIAYDTFDEYLVSELSDNITDNNEQFLENINDYDSFMKFAKTEHTDSFKLIEERFSNGKYLFPTKIISYESNIINDFKKYIVDGTINENKINSGEEIILYAPKNSIKSIQKGKYGINLYTQLNESDIEKDETILVNSERSLKVGDTLDLSILSADSQNEENNDIPNDCKENIKKVKIGAIIENPPKEISITNTYQVSIITSNEGMNKFYKNANYNRIEVLMEDEISDEIDNEIMQLLNDVSGRVEQGYNFSKYQLIKDDQNNAKTLFVSMIAILILFFSIIGSIINNTITANIRESKKEIGTLRAVGASEREIISSYIRQILSVFIWGYGIGFGICIVAYIIYMIVTKIKATEFIIHLNIWQTAIAALILFAICIINIWIKIRKEMKNSIVENIREL